MLRKVIVEWPEDVGTLGALAFNPLLAIPQDERELALSMLQLGTQSARHP